jgi:hypothetical protein
MPDDPETRLVLRQAGQLRTDVANFESGLDVIMTQLVRLPSRGELWGAVLMGRSGARCPQGLWVWSSSCVDAAFKMTTTRLIGFERASDCCAATSGESVRRALR